MLIQWWLQHLNNGSNRKSKQTSQGSGLVIKQGKQKSKLNQNIGMKPNKRNVLYKTIQYTIQQQKLKKRKKEGKGNAQ